MGQFPFLSIPIMTKILLIFAVLGTSVSFVKTQCQLTESDGFNIACIGLQDGDLPGAVESFSGHYDNLFIQASVEISSSLTILKSNSFPGLSFDQVYFDKLTNLEIVEEAFLQGTEEVTWRLSINKCPSLRDFPFHYMEKFRNLEYLAIGGTGIEMIPSDIKWPSTLILIQFFESWNLKSIESHAFSSAVNLERVLVSEVAKNFVVKSNGFHKSSTTATSDLTVYPGGGYITLEANAFGNVEGGQLWQTLNLGASDFNEQALRLLIKAHFDKGHTSFLGPKADAFHNAIIVSCENPCDHAWLYKDAQQFGFEPYKRFIGNNAICPDVGPILETDDADFIAQMNGCPYTPIPWPEDNDCKDVTDPMQDVAPDSENCHCFYECAGGQVMGHECCAPGLAFNPSLLACDWSENVENCD